MQYLSNSIRNGLLAALFIAALAGCGSLQRPYPNRTLHTLSAGSPAETVAAHGNKILRIGEAQVVRPYDGLTFVYKTGDSTYAVDYYNGFIAPPGSIITVGISDWLSASGLYSSVVSGDSTADSDLSLETNVTALYGDYSKSGAPVAIIGTRIFLLDHSGSKSSIIFQHDYSETEPIPSRTPAELVKGWERGYRRILTQLVADLQKPAAPAATGAAAQ